MIQSRLKPAAREILITSHNVIPAASNSEAGQAGIQFFNSLPKSWMASHSAVESRWNNTLLRGF